MISLESMFEQGILHQLQVAACEESKWTECNSKSDLEKLKTGFQLHGIYYSIRKLGIVVFIIGPLKCLQLSCSLKDCIYHRNTSMASRELSFL